MLTGPPEMAKRKTLDALTHKRLNYTLRQFAKNCQPKLEYSKKYSACGKQRCGVTVALLEKGSALGAHRSGILSRGAKKLSEYFSPLSPQRPCSPAVFSGTWSPKLLVKPMLLQTLNLSKSFKGLTALKNHRLSVEKGEIVGVIGPNGSGKSTLFNLISGFLPPTTGTVHFEGREIERLEPAQIARLGIARTFQGTRLFKNLSVLENLRSAAQLRHPVNIWEATLGLGRAAPNQKAIEAKSREMLELVGLGEVAQMPAGSLPYGHQRRLEIARALATEPKLLMMDEPAAGLDSRETEALLHLIRQIRDQYGVGVMVIEHDMDLVMSLCERIQVLAYGETIAEGTPQQVQANSRVREAYLGGEA